MLLVMLLLGKPASAGGQPSAEIDGANRAMLMGNTALVVEAGGLGTLLIVNSGDADGARWIHRTSGGGVRTLGTGLGQLQEVVQVLVSPDGASCAVLSVGEGHPVVAVLDLAALLRGEEEPKAAIDPYPGSIELVEWRQEGLILGSDVRLDLRSGDGRIPIEALEDRGDSQYALDLATGKTRRLGESVTDSP